MVVPALVLVAPPWIYDFIECYTTTFLRAHSWLNWVDEDDDEVVGLKEKPEDTRHRRGENGRSMLTSSL